MTILLRTLLTAAGIAIQLSGVVHAGEDPAPRAREETPPTAAGGEIDPAAGDLELMREEIRLREELAAKVQGGASESELAGLRRQLDRLEKARRARRQSGNTVAGGVDEDETTTDGAAGPPGGAEPIRDAGEPRSRWPFVEGFFGELRVPFAALVIAIVLQLAAGWRVRRWLATIRSRLPKRPGGPDDDPRWRQAERFLLLSISLVILLGLVTVLLVETGLASGTTVVILFVLVLAVLWPFRHVVEDAIGGLTLLSRGNYQVGDMVDLVDASGLVESMTLFETALRDMEGSVHFVPHRLAGAVRNSTYDWARAVIEVAVTHDADVDRIMRLLLEVAREVAQSPPFVEFVLEEPRMLGVESIDSSQVVIKFFMKTTPRSRNMVKREVQRRVNQRFRELGIEVPFPPRSLHHRIEKPPQGPGTDARGQRSEVRDQREEKR